MVTRKEYGGTDSKSGIDMYTLLCLEQITKKDLLYSTGNSIFCSNLKEKESEKKNVYVYKTQSLCYTPETNNVVNQLYLKLKKFKPYRYLIKYLNFKNVSQAFPMVP